LVSILLFSCVPEVAKEEPVLRVEVRNKVNKTEVVTGATQTTPSTVKAKGSGSQCDDNSKCAASEKCVDGMCKTIASLYETNCEKKCTIKQVTLMTNDGEKVTVRSGEGNYAYAGAMGYDVLKTPQYCPGTDVVVPLEIEKVTTGKVLGTEVIALKKGEKGSVITHPTITRVQFTLEVKDIKEECA